MLPNHHQSLLLVLTILAIIIVQECKALTENLVFRADCKLVSNEFLVENPLDWESFLRQERTRDLFLSAGGRRECHQVPTSTPVQKLWAEACANYEEESGCLPHSPPVFVATETDVKFPGFQMRNTVLNGCQLDSKGVNLCYTFCLIGDQKMLQGSRPVVWLVNKLTGISNDARQQGFFQATETKANTKIYAVPSKRMNMKLQMDIDFTTTVTFPKVLLKLLPASKQKVQERGSRSIHQVVEKDAQDALNAVRDSWLEYCGSKILMLQDKEEKVHSRGRRLVQGVNGEIMRPKLPMT